MKPSIMIFALLTMGLQNYGDEQAGSARQESDAATLNELLETRRDVLKRRLELIEAENESGTKDITELTEANLQLKNADLAITTSPAARIAILERVLKYQEQLEVIMQEKFQTGTINESCYLAIKAARLKVQIELRKEKQ